VLDALSGKVAKTCQGLGVKSVQSEEIAKQDADALLCQFIGLCKGKSIGTVIPAARAVLAEALIHAGREDRAKIEKLASDLHAQILYEIDLMLERTPSIYRKN